MTEPCEHEWRPMSSNEAYPASSGKVCTKCDQYRLGWFCDINEPNGDDTATRIARALTGERAP